MPNAPFHVAVISWDGKAAAARQIAAALAGAAQVSVIYSNRAEQPETGPGSWLQLPNSAYFGPKFALALAQTPPGCGLLLIHADTTFPDWPQLFQRCGLAFASFADLAVWSPDFSFTPWRTDLVQVFAQPSLAGLVSVMQTDGIVTAFSPGTVDRLRRLDLTGNNLGWGIDWVAVAHAYATGQRVLRDTTLRVSHPRSRSYRSSEAGDTMRSFFAQLTDAERAQIALLRAYFYLRKDDLRPWYARLWYALGAKRKDPLSGL